MKKIILLLAVGLLLISCSDDDATTASGTITPTFKSPSSRGLRMPKIPEFSFSDFNPFRAAGDVGHNTTAGLTSYKYYVTRVDLCNDLTITGTGYSNQSGCVTLFGASNADNAYGTYKIANADAEDDSTVTSWVDIVAGKTATASSITAGTYNYGIIETRKPVKMNATITVPNGNVTLKTCTGGIVTEDAGDGSTGSLQETVTVSDMTSCTQAEATVGAQGGGQWFKFQSPITIAADTSYVLDLVANPTQLIAGGVEAIGGWGDEAAYKDGTYVMLVPPISVIPVVRASTATTIREQYTIDTMTGLDGSILLDLYYVGTTSDVGTGTVIGAGARFINNSDATEFVKMYNPYTVTTNSDGTITIGDYDSKSIVENLTRSTTATTGGTQTVTVNQSVLYNGTTGATDLSGTATFNGLTEL